MDRQSRVEPWIPVPRVPGVVVAASLGAAWGLAGYALLWGSSPIIIQRSFVVSPVGTILLLPVRAVLATIRMVEDHLVGRPFELGDAHGWIGVAAAAVGAALAIAGFLTVRGVARLRRGEGSR